MKKIEKFMLPEHTNKLYTNEAISSISLTRDIAEKLNEIIETLNEFSNDDLTWKHEQEGTIRKGVLFMKDNLLNSLNDLMVTLRDSGYVDARIEYHCDYLKQRLDNLISGKPTDGELVDIRTGYNGKIYNNAGNSVRGQFMEMDELKLSKLDSVKPKYETKNLLLNDWFKEGYYYSAEGIYALHHNGGHYPLVEVEPNTIYTYYGCQILVMFDKDMNVTGSDTVQVEDFKHITTTADTKYIAVSKSLNNNVKSGLYKGIYYGKVEPGAKMLTLDQIHGMVELLEEIERCVKGTAGKNLFNKNSKSIVNGQYVLYTDGAIGGNANYSYDVIKVLPDTTYVVNSNKNEHIAFFDENDKFISGLSTNQSRTFTTPTNTSYLTFSYKTEYKDILQLEKGSESTDYAPYETGISSEWINGGSITYEKLGEDVKSAIGSAKKIVTVGVGKDYESLTKAIAENQNNTMFKVYTGVYDLYNEYLAFYGSDYFTKYSGYQTTGRTHDRGLNLGKGCELIGVGHVEIVFNYNGNNEQVKKYFAPINTTSENKVENITFKIADGSCRYHIHDDFAETSGTNHFKNLSFYGDPYLHTAIGGGMGVDNTYIIEDCYFKEAGSLSITYHNNVNAAKNKMIVKDCYCDGSIRATHYGTSTEKSKLFVSNCKASDVYITFGDANIYPNENIELFEWNNVKG